MIEKVKMHTVTPEGVQWRDDVVAREEPLEIRIAFGAGAAQHRQSLAVTMRTPGQDADLALGFLFTEGIIATPDQVLQIRQVDADTLLATLQTGVEVDMARLTRHLFTSSSCGVCGKASLDAVQTVACHYPVPGSPQIPAAILYSLPERLRSAQATFELTGGLHAAALFDVEGRLLLLREDIGRHNAVDKVIGAALAQKMALPFRDLMLMVSGRAGFELVQKATMAGLPMLAAVGAPSSLSVELAEAGGLTLVGFLRGERFNVYTHPERIIGPAMKSAD
ncbi:MAG TPA: formate dehydrogenase accessory sulfurtransferase FdhD [Saprospiraceae bacterium]|nr:formate dehydrogenase accessory sulfurtransferase FdhD [Saprospiraceae bacterium]